MDFQLSFKINDKIFLKDPENSDLGKEIVRHAIVMIAQLGFENFTFKKLALEMKTTEASVYRYFENKHRLLLYILNWYWCYMEFLLIYRVTHIPKPKDKLKAVIHLFAGEIPNEFNSVTYDLIHLNQIVISESSKVYLTKEVNEINKDKVFNPYKELCTKISAIILENNHSYCFARSLSSTIIETAHSQQFFSRNLPKLTDVGPKNQADYTAKYLENLVFKAIDLKNA